MGQKRIKAALPSPADPMSSCQENSYRMTQPFQRFFPLKEQRLRRVFQEERAHACSLSSLHHRRETASGAALQPGFAATITCRRLGGREVRQLYRTATLPGHLHGLIHSCTRQKFVFEPPDAGDQGSSGRKGAEVQPFGQNNSRLDPTGPPTHKMDTHGLQNMF